MAACASWRKCHLLAKAAASAGQSSRHHVNVSLYHEALIKKGCGFAEVTMKIYARRVGCRAFVGSSTACTGWPLGGCEGDQHW